MCTSTRSGTARGRSRVCLSRPARLLGCVTLTLLLSVTRVAGAPDLRLLDAVRQQNIEMARALLRQHVDVNARQPDGATALHWAVQGNDVDLAALLVGAGANVSAANELGVTPLFLASDLGSPRMVETLLAAGARPGAAFSAGETELMAAARSGSVPIVRALLASGADVNARETRRGQTALMWAAAGRHPAVVQTLIESGADVHVRSRVTRLTVNISDPFNTRGRTSDGPDRGRAPDPHVAEIAQGGSSALLFAARNGDVESARILLDAGADVNGTAADGTSAVVMAAHSNQGPLAAFLLARGADPNAAGGGYAALHAAVLRGDRKLLEALLTRRADPNAAITSPTQSTRFSCNFTFPDNLIGSTPFLLAARLAEPELMRELVAGGADPRRTMPDGTTPLMLAAGIGFGAGDRRQRPACADGPHDSEGKALDAVAVAIEAGADVNATNAAGESALHGAAAQGLTAVVRLLAQRGARLDARDQFGRTPLSGASSRARDGGESAAAVLRKLGAKE